MSQSTRSRSEGKNSKARRAVALARVLDAFDLSQQEVAHSPFDTTFTTQTEGQGRLYGGMSMALAYLAADRTVDEKRRLHSAFCTFLRPGRPNRDLGVDVMKTRDGRSFSSRRSQVRQRSSVLLDANLSFRTVPERHPSGLVERTGIDHSIAELPQIPAPQECPDREQERSKRLGQEWLEHPVNAVEVRLTDARQLQSQVHLPPHSINWVRVPGSKPLDETQRIALLLFASDRALLTTALLPHGILWSGAQAVTLNHGFWLHRLPEPHLWHAFVAESRIAVDGLAMLHLEMFDQKGNLVATAVQEALVQY